MTHTRKRRMFALLASLLLTILSLTIISAAPTGHTYKPRQDGAYGIIDPTTALVTFDGDTILDIQAGIAEETYALYFNEMMDIEQAKAELEKLVQYALENQTFDLPDSDDPVLGIMSAELSLVMLECQEKQLKGYNGITSEMISFRDVAWGEKKSVVDAAVTKGLTENVDYYIDDDTTIITEASVAGYDAHIYYMFDDNQTFDSAAYILDEKHSNDNQYYYDYEDLVDKLTDKYGEPDYSYADWDDDLYRDDPKDWGFAVACGDVEFSSSWQDKEGNTILLVLSGDNYEISTHLIYYSGKRGREKRSNSDGL